MRRKARQFLFEFFQPLAGAFHVVAEAGYVGRKALRHHRADQQWVLVEEVLRLSTPTANMWRVCKQDTEVNGTKIPAGSMIQIRYSSADRDERIFERAEAFDVTRKNARQNVAFGYGVHMCIGASLARKEMEVAFRVLLGRVKDIALDCAESDLLYPPNVLLRGLATLPIRFAPQR